MKKVTFHEEAQSEANDAAHYYEKRAPGLGSSFLDDVEKAAEQILSTPGCGQVVGDEVRRKLLKRFPYSLLYIGRTRPYSRHGRCSPKTSGRILRIQIVKNGEIGTNRGRHGACLPE